MTDLAKGTRMYAITDASGNVWTQAFATSPADAMKRLQSDDAGKYAEYRRAAESGKDMDVTLTLEIHEITATGVKAADPGLVLALACAERTNTDPKKQRIATKEPVEVWPLDARGNIDTKAPVKVGDGKTKPTQDVLKADAAQPIATAKAKG